jgi:VCBS repeat-containing protein
MAWTDDLTNDSLKTLTLQASSDNTYTYQEILAILESAAAGGITSSEWVDLKSIYTNASDSFASDYLDKITYNVIYTNTANAKWWGGATSYSNVETLGNMFAGMSEQKTGWLIDKWFMGLDLPMPIAGGDPADTESSADTYNYSMSDGPLFIDGVEASDITQGSTGDCYLLACLGAISTVSTDFIEDMFIDNGNGTYGVRFYLNNEAVYTTVNLELPTKDSGNIAFGSNSSRDVDGETWISLLEKAYVQLNMQADINNEDSDWDGENSYYAIEGGLASPLNQITNLDVTYYSSYYTSSGDDFSAGLYKSSNANTYKQTIIDALDAGSAGWLGTWGNTSGDTGKKNFIYGHAFIIVGYDSNTDLFTFRNPWGDGGSSYDGEFQAAIEDFWNSSVKGLVALTEPLTNATPDPTPDPEPDPDFTVTSSSISVTEGGSKKIGILDSQTATYSAALGQGSIAGFTLYSNGSYNFDPDNSSYDYLAAGDALQLTFNYSATNGQNQIAYGSLTINITGTDDPTSFSGTTTGTVVEDLNIEATGTLNVSDLDSREASVISQNNTSGSYGKFTINSSGEWRYVLDNNLSQVQALIDNQITNDIFTVEALSGSSTDITISIHGSNESLLLADFSETVYEGNQLTNQSVYDPSLEVTYAQSRDQENIPGLVFNSDGSYSFDASISDYDHLKSGELLELLFGFMATNSQEETGESTLKITIIGRNDTPTLNTDLSNLEATFTDTIINDQFSTVKGSISVEDLDNDSLRYFVNGSRTMLAGHYGIFSIVKSTGDWSYTPFDSKIEAIKEYDSDTFSLTITDGIASIELDLIIHINGTNDQTYISGINSGSVTEDSSTTTEGSLTVSDLDTDDSNMTPQTNTLGSYGYFSISSNGKWKYNLNNNTDTVQNLAKNQSVTDSFIITTSGDIEETITITINGQNDKLQLNNQFITAVEGGTALSGSVSDADQSMVYTSYDEQENIPGLTFYDDGSYHFNPSNTQYDYLDEGETTEIGFSYTATNQYGEVGNASLTISFTGINDAPLFDNTSSESIIHINDTNADDQLNIFSGTLSATDSDGDTLNYFLSENINSKIGTYGTLNLDNDDGSWIFTPNKSAIEALKSNTSEIFVAFVSDGITTDEIDITVNIYGSEDPTFFAGELTASVIEDETTLASGSIEVTDRDYGDTEIIIQSNTIGSYGDFSIDSDGQWNYILDNSNDHVQALYTNQIVEDIFTIATINGESENIIISISGRNDEITLSNSYFSATENSGTINGSVANAAITVTYEASDGQGDIKGLTFNSDGSYSFNSNHEEFDNLREGETLNLIFSYTGTNEKNETGSASLNITLNGSNDQTSFSGDIKGSVIEDEIKTTSGRLIVTDLDSGDSDIISQIESLGLYGSFSIDNQGNWNYLLDNGSNQVQSLTEDQTAIDQFTITTTDGITQSINIEITGHYDDLKLTNTSVIVNEGDDEITGQVSNIDADYSPLDNQTTISGLAFNADGSYHFNAANIDYDYLTANDSLELTLPYQAINTQGESGNAELKITLLGVNDLPVLVQPLSNLNAVIGTSFSYQIAANSFTDPDQDEQLGYTAYLTDGTALPDWLQFDSDNQILSGNTSNQTANKLDIRITATDSQGGNTSEDFTLTLIADDQPLANSSADDLIYGSDSDHDTALVSCLPGQYVYDDGQLSGADGNDSLVDVEYIGFGYQYGDAFQVDVLVEDLIDPDGEDGEEKSNAAQLMDKISDLYIAYFGRAPDASGFTYWFKEIYTGSHTFEDAANAFSYSQEYQDNYPEGTSNRDFIETVYINLFNRKPDTGGWDYWEGRLDEGLTRDIFLLSVVNGAYATTSGEDDRSLLGNKHDISVYYAEQSTLYPNEGFDEAINLLLNRVTDDANTALSAITVINHAFENEVTLSGIFEDQNLLDQLWS